MQGAFSCTMVFAGTATCRATQVQGANSDRIRKLEQGNVVDRGPAGFGARHEA